MAPKKGGKEGKRPHKNQPTSKKYKKYSIEGDKLKKKMNCPKCGPGIFFMETPNRNYCGRCHYTEFKLGAKK